MPIDTITPAYQPPKIEDEPADEYAIEPDLTGKLFSACNKVPPHKAAITRNETFNRKMFITRLTIV